MSQEDQQEPSSYPPTPNKNNNKQSLQSTSPPPYSPLRSRLSTGTLTKPNPSYIKRTFSKLSLISNRLSLYNSPGYTTIVPKNKDPVSNTIGLIRSCVDATYRSNKVGDVWVYSDGVCKDEAKDLFTVEAKKRIYSPLRNSVTSVTKTGKISKPVKLAKPKKKTSHSLASPGLTRDGSPASGSNDMLLRILSDPSLHTTLSISKAFSSPEFKAYMSSLNTSSMVNIKNGIIATALRTAKKDNVPYLHPYIEKISFCGFASVVNDLYTMSQTNHSISGSISKEKFILNELSEILKSTTLKVIMFDTTGIFHKSEKVLQLLSKSKKLEEVYFNSFFSHCVSRNVSRRSSDDTVALGNGTNQVSGLDGLNIVDHNGTHSSYYRWEQSLKVLLQNCPIKHLSLPWSQKFRPAKLLELIKMYGFNLSEVDMRYVCFAEGPYEIDVTEEDRVAGVDVSQILRGHRRLHQRGRRDVRRRERNNRETGNARENRGNRTERIKNTERIIQTLNKNKVRVIVGNKDDGLLGIEPMDL